MAGKSKLYFEPVDPKLNFPEAEKKLLSRWYKTGLVKKYLRRNKNSKKYFSFLDGPITANNPMGVHHAWGRTYKDIWQRFKNMQGYRQRFQNGFDCQGLWVEVEVEKELQFKNKKDIETFGVEKFVQLCRDRVKKYSGIQTEQSKRLGYFMDWDNSYYTLSEDNNYMIWHFLKVCYDNGWIYKGADVVPWCPRCETAISEHEILTEDYKEVTHESIFLSFPIVGQENEYLLVWTTTPWTVPANIAVAVDGDMEYVLAEVGKNKYWIGEDAAQRVFAGRKYKILKSVRGSKLVGLRYTAAFDDLPAVKSGAGKNDKFHTVVSTDPMLMPITATEGTGLVHTSTGTGTEDYKLGQKIGLPIIPAIDDMAEYLSGFDFLTGKNAKKHPELILDYLSKYEDGKFVFKTEKYTHRYPACWRCKTELVWKVTDEWYISMDRPATHKRQSRDAESEKWNSSDEEPEVSDVRTLREKMKEVAGKISWLPGFGLDREMDWLANMHDWLISKKNRYWGLALPIWECPKCGNFEVIGSKEELNKRSVTGKLKGSPHKPQIDEIKIKCSKCGAIAPRIEPVGNPWLDAGIVPFSTISENNKACGFGVTTTKPLYLTDKESWGKWFPADFITESFPGQFKNWFYSLIAMSTVLENANPFKTVLGFGTLLGEDGRPMHKSWGNSIEFNEGADKIGVDVMRWMFARANPAENMLFGYKVADEIRRRFHLKLWNIYNFFVTYANLDGWTPQRGKERVKSINVLDRWILIRLGQITTSVTEAMEKFNAVSASGEIEKFIDDVSLWYVRRSRSRVGPAAESEKDRNSFYATTYKLLCDISKILAPFTPFVADIMYSNLTKEESVHLADFPVSSLKIGIKGAELVEEMQMAREVVEKAHAVRKEKGIPVRQPLSMLSISNYQFSKEISQLIADEVNVKSVVSKSGKGELSVRLDIKITRELQEEAMIRDVVRKIQEERKNLGLNLTQKVNVYMERIPLDKKVTQWMIRKAQIAKLSEGKFKVVRSS